MRPISRALPWLLAATIFCGGLLLNEGRERVREHHDQIEGRVVAQQLASRLTAWLGDRVAIIEHVAQSHGTTVAVDSSVFVSEATTFVSRVSGFQAFNWIAQDGRITVVVPLDANRGAIGRNPLEHPQDHVREAARKALLQRLPARTGAVDLYQGGVGISVYWPVEAPNGGIVNGVFRVAAIIEDALPEADLGARFHLRLVDGDGTLIWANSDWNAVTPSAIVAEAMFVDRPLGLRVASRAVQPANIGVISLLSLVASALLGVGGGWLLHSYLKRQHQALQRGRRLALIMDSAGEALVGLDLAGNCVFCNAASVRLLGYRDAEELTGQPVLERHLQRLPAHDLQGATAAQAVLRDLRNARTLNQRGAMFLRTDGTPTVVQLRATPIVEAGTVTGAVLTFSDINEEIAESERLYRYRQLIDNIPVMTAITDKAGLMATINPAGVQLLGTEEDALVGTPLLDIFAPADRLTIEQAAWPALESGGIWEGEAWLQRKDTDGIPTRIVLMRLKEDRFGDTYHVLIARDIREERRLSAEQQSLRRQFEQAQKMESLGVLAGGIAHDFNNILVAVLGNASLALEKFSPGSEEHGLISAVETASLRAADLTRQLLAYSGHGRFELAPTDIGALVEEMADLLRVSTPPSVRLSVKCESDLPAALVDPTQIRQLVMNLITNAADAIGPDRQGEVKVGVERIQWDPGQAPSNLYGERLARGSYVAIKVEDDGAGIPKDVLARIFDPFFTTKDTGKGLGLSAVLGIVQGHSAMLCVESDPQTGTCFMLVLPPSALTAAVREAPPVAADGAFSGTILLIDDEPAVRDFVEAALATLGFQVIVAKDGNEGLALFGQHHRALTLILIDQSMPGMSGAQTLRRMQEVDNSVPAVLMSGYDEEQVSSALADIGFYGFLQKPFRFGDLRSLLRRVLDKDA